MNMTTLIKGDKVSFRNGNHIHYGTVSGFTKHKVRVKYTYAGFENDKLMFERNLVKLS